MKPPAQGRAEYSDASLSGFVLRVTSRGLKSFTYVYRFRGEQRRADIGSFPPLTLGEARDMARHVWAEVQRGHDPRETLAWLKNRAAVRRKAEAPEGRFTDLCRAYLADSQRWLRTSTHLLYRRLVDRQLLPAFGARDPSTITRADVKTWSTRLRKTPTQANRSMAVMRLVCDWAVREGRLTASPCVGLKKPAPEVARSRYLSHDEIRAVFEALKRERPLIAAYYELLFFTGVRRSKPLEAEWKDVDTKTAVWHIPITKRARGT